MPSTTALTLPRWSVTWIIGTIALTPGDVSLATNLPPAKPAFSRLILLPVFLYIKEPRYRIPSSSPSSALTFVPSAR
jgi:hypothetical protein